MSEQNYKTGVYTYNGEEHSFNFKTYLSATDKVYVVNFVTDILVDDSYNYVLKDMIFNFGIINVFTDIDVSYIFSDECENSIDAIEELVSKTNIVDVIYANVDYYLIAELYNAVELNIEYKTGIHRNELFDSISDLLKTLERKIDEFDLDMDKAMEVVNVLSGIPGGLTVDKMLDAYKKSDVYKLNNEDNFYVVDTSSE